MLVRLFNLYLCVFINLDQSVNKSPSQNQVVLPGIEENLNEDVLLVSNVLFWKCV